MNSQSRRPPTGWRLLVVVVWLIEVLDHVGIIEQVIAPALALSKTECARRFWVAEAAGQGPGQ
jgi:hypothetical protein